MALELGGVFLLAPDDLPTVKALPGVTGQLIAKSKGGGWLIACTFPGEDSPGVIASVVAETWFNLGRWTITSVEPLPDIPLPLNVVGDVLRKNEMLVNFDGERVRAAREDELDLLGRPTTSSPVRLLKVCHAYAGNNDNPADLKDLEERKSFETYMAKAALMAERLRVDAQDTVQGDPQGALWRNTQDTVREHVQDTIRDDN